MFRTATRLILLLIVLAAGAVFVFTETEAGRAKLAGLVSRLASTPDRTVEIGAINGVLNGALTVEHVVVGDADGPWLVLRDLAIDWSPRELLRRSFDADRIRAGRVEMARLPKSPPPDPAASDRPFSLPVSIRIGEIDLPEIALGAGIAGDVATLSAGGSASADRDPLKIVADIQAERTDGQKGTLAAKIDFAPAENVLQLDVAGNEPEGGILASLLQLPGKPAVDVSLSGGGPIADWRGKASLAIDGAPVTSLAVTHRETDAGRRVTAQGEGDFLRFVPEVLRPLVTGTVMFDLAGTLRQDGGVAVEHAVFESDAVSAKASGSIDSRAESDLTAELAARGDPVTLAFGDGAEPAIVAFRSANFTVGGTGASPEIDGSADFASVQAAGFGAADVSATFSSPGFDIAKRTGPFVVDIEAGGVGTVNAALAPLVAGGLDVHVEGAVESERIAIRSATVRNDQLGLGASGAISRTDGAVAADVSLDVAVAALPAAARGPLGDRLSLTGKIERAAGGAIGASDLVVKSGPLDATGRASLDGGTIAATLSGAYADIAKISAQASGAVSFEATAKGSVTAPEIAVTIGSKRIESAGRAITDLVFTASGTVDPAKPVADVTLKGAVEGKTIEGRALLRSQDGASRVEELLVGIGQNRITGTLDLDRDFVPEGVLTFTLPDIGPLAAIALESASGNLDGTVTFTRRGGVPVVDVEAAVGAFSRGTLSGRTVSVSANVADYLKAPTISGRIKAAEVKAGDTVIGGIDVRLTRDGDWTGFSGGATVADIPATAAGRVRVAGGTTTIELASAKGAFRGIDAALARPTSIVIRDGRTTLDRLALGLGGGTAEISGTVGDALALDVRLAGIPAALANNFAPGLAAAGTIAGTVNVRGADGSIAIIGSADLASVQAAGFGAAEVSARFSSAGFDIATRTGPFVLDIEAGGVGTVNAALAPLVAGGLDVHVEGAVENERIAIRSATVRNDQLGLGASGAISRADGAVAADVSLDVAVAALPAAARGPLGDRLSLTGKIERAAGGAIGANDLVVKSGPLDATGRASLDGGTIAATLSGAYADIAKISAQASGAVSFEATAKGSVTAPEVAVTIGSKRIESAGRAITDLVFTASGTVDPAKPVADVTLKGAVEGKTIEGRALLRSQDGASRVEELLVGIGQNRITGTLDLDRDFVPEGVLTFTLPDIGPLAAIALESASGNLDGTVTFTRRGGVPVVDVEAAVGAFSRGTLSGRTVSVSANVADYLKAPTISGRIKAAEVKAGDTVIGGIDVRLTRDGDWTGFSGGATVADIPATAAGRVRVAGGTTTIELASAKGAFRGIDAALARPTSIVIRDGRTTLDRLALGLGGGTAEISGTVGDALALDVRLAGIPAALANNFAPGLAAAGTIAGTVNVRGAPAAPRIGYAIDWAGAATSQTRDAGFGAFTVNSSGDFAGNALTFRANVGDGSGLGLNGGGTVNTAGQVGLNLNFSGRVPFSFLTRRLAVQALSLTGAADLTIAVTGPAAAPVISGTVRTAGARFVDARTGIAINDLSADVALGNGTATLRSARGTLSSGGSLSASGTVGIAAGSGFPANLALKIVEGRYTDGRVVTATLDGNLNITGPLMNGPLLSGKIALGRTVITVPERLPASLAAIDVQHRNATAEVKAQAAAMRPAQASGGGNTGLVLDVTVDAPNRIFIQGRGVDAELGGNIRLTGPASSPVAVGRFTLVRGRLGILGKRLEFTRGTIGFDGSLIPRLDFAADTRANDATATILVTGEANNPKFSFTSVPSLPEDEIMARVIFGRSMSRLSPLQIAQLAAAAGQLAGIGGSTSLLTNLQNRIGLDNLDIRTDEETGRAAVAVGKYLNDRTYLGLEKGEGPGSGRATIDLSIGRGVKLRGEARDDGRAKGGIFYEREY